MEVAQVAGDGGEAVLEAGVRIGLVLEAKAVLELLDGDLEHRHVRWLETIESSEAGVDGDDDDDGLEVLRGVHGGDTQVDVVGELGAAASRDNTHIEKLREEGVLGAHDGGGLRRGGAASGGCELQFQSFFLFPVK